MCLPCFFFLPNSKPKHSIDAKSCTAQHGYLGVRDDAVDFENLLVWIGLSDVKLPDHGCPVTLTATAVDVRVTC